MSELKLHELRTLDALARSGSIVGTAKALFMSPAAVHKRLELLGEKLGVPVYEVIGHDLRLTDAAKVVLPHVRTLLSHYEAIFSSLREWEGSDRGSIRIATGTTVSVYILPALLEAYRRVAPGVEIVVDTGTTPQVLDSLAEGASDVVITLATARVEEPVYRVQARWESEMVIVTTPERPYGPCALSELATVPFILYRDGSRLGAIVEQYFAQVGFQPRVAMRFDNPETIKAMVRSGLGISVLPRWVVETELTAGRLLRIEQREPPGSVKMALITRRDAYTPRAHQAFLELARGWEWRAPAE